MAYVQVPPDLERIKNKLVLGLTRRQLICFSIGAAMGFPVFFLTQGIWGNTTAGTAMVFVMIPAFLFAMYEKDGLTLEVVLMNLIRVKFLRPAIRRYETENMYETVDTEASECEGKRKKKKVKHGKKKKRKEKDHGPEFNSV